MSQRSREISRRLMETCLPDEIHDAVIGDIEEQYAGSIWYWPQVFLVLIHSLRFKEAVMKDIHYAFRSLRKKPAYTAICILTLALGVACSTSVFTVFSSVILRPLPYPNAQRVLMVSQTNLKRGIVKGKVSPPNFLDLRARTSAFELLAAIRPYELERHVEGASRRIPTSLVTKGYFEILGLSALYGRTFVDAEFEADGPRALVLSYALWQREYHGDSGVIGKAELLDDQVYTIVGVMPPEFRHPAKTVEAWSTFRIVPALMRQRVSTYLEVIGRPRSTVTMQQATADMEKVMSQLVADYPGENEGVGVSVETLADHEFGAVRRPLAIVLFCVMLVLLVACLNVANFMLVRGSERMQEFALRAALGAGRWRILRQLSIEAISIAGTGSLIGLGAAWWLARIFPRFSPEDFPRIDDIGIDWRVGLFAAAVAVSSAIIFTIAPSAHAMTSRRLTALRTGFGIESGSYGDRLRRFSTVAQISLALALMIAGGLLTRSFMKLLNVDPGFSRKNILMTELHIWDRFPKPEQQAEFFDTLIQRVGALPGVESAAAACALPFLGEPSIEMVTKFRSESNANALLTDAFLTIATPGYFQVMGIPIVNGRAFERADTGAAKVAVITEGIARTYWHGENPVGRRILLQDEGKFETHEIIGVVGDVQHTGLTDKRRDEIFVPLRQKPFGSMMLVTRSSGDPAGVVAAVRQEVLAMDSLQSFRTIATISDLVGRTLVTPRFYLLLVASFGVTAFGLAVLGVYGVMNLSTRHRTREFGLRLSVGAQSRDIARIVVGDGLRLIGTGVVAGLAISLTLSRFLAGLLFHVSVNDTWTFAASTLLLVGVALLACYVPARRASRLDPMIALRFE